MIVRSHGTRTGWSSPQVCAGSMTLHLGTKGALSRSSKLRSSSGVADGVAKQRLGPFELAHQLFGVGVDQQFVVVETVAVGRVIRAVHTVAVNQPGVGVGQVAVEDFIGVFGEFDTFQFDHASVVEQA